MSSGDEIDISLSGSFVVRITNGYPDAVVTAPSKSSGVSIWATGAATVQATSYVSVSFNIFRIPTGYDIIRYGQSSVSYPSSELTSSFSGCIGFYPVKKMTYTLKYRMSSSDDVYVYGPISGSLNKTYSSSSSSTYYEKTFDGERMLFCMYCTSYSSPSQFQVSAIDYVESSYSSFYAILSTIIAAIVWFVCCTVCCSASCKNPEKRSSTSSSSSKPKPKVIIQPPQIENHHAPQPQIYSPSPYYANGPSFGVPGSPPPMTPPMVPNPMISPPNPNMGYQVPSNSYGAVDPYQQAYQNENGNYNPYIL